MNDRKSAIRDPESEIECEVKEMREIILLACGECKRKNYSTTKNKRNTPDKLNLDKYCRFCRKHSVHKETKA